MKKENVSFNPHLPLSFTSFPYTQYPPSLVSNPTPSPHHNPHPHPQPQPPPPLTTHNSHPHPQPQPPPPLTPHNSHPHPQPPTPASTPTNPTPQSPPSPPTPASTHTNPTLTPNPTNTHTNPTLTPNPCLHPHPQPRSNPMTEPPDLFCPGQVIAGSLVSAAAPFHHPLYCDSCVLASLHPENPPTDTASTVYLSPRATPLWPTTTTTTNTMSTAWGCDAMLGKGKIYSS
ncbi:hypothetical protein Pcinc_044201 [Petrolisthes cinctipes]|uniref:Uncharacterized protein n=1 Tax=Petrolisthes cinctipes TaxID=88211 RepID=A0AAE1EFL4_PETCI|nr:hypothetical protein Pcinc_044201 [Petrolisthes cinctipes]